MNSSFSGTFLAIRKQYATILFGITIVLSINFNTFFKYNNGDNYLTVFMTRE